MFDMLKHNDDYDNDNEDGYDVDELIRNYFKYFSEFFEQDSENSGMVLAGSNMLIMLDEEKIDEEHMDNLINIFKTIRNTFYDRQLFIDENVIFLTNLIVEFEEEEEYEYCRNLTNYKNKIEQL